MNMIDLKIAYGDYTGMIAAVESGAMVADTIAQIAVGKDIPGGKRTMPKGFTQEKVQDIADSVTQINVRAQASVLVMKAALGRAGIFPKFHALETKDEAIITVRFTEEALVAIVRAIMDITTGVRAMSTGFSLRAMPDVFMETLVALPFDSLKKHTPAFIRAMLDANAPLF